MAKKEKIFTVPGYDEPVAQMEVNDCLTADGVHTFLEFRAKKDLWLLFSAQKALNDAGYKENIILEGSSSPYGTVYLEVIADKPKVESTQTSGLTVIFPETIIEAQVAYYEDDILERIAVEKILNDFGFEAEYKYARDGNGQTNIYMMLDTIVSDLNLRLSSAPIAMFSGANSAALTAIAALSNMEKYDIKHSRTSFSNDPDALLEIDCVCGKVQMAKKELMKLIADEQILSV